MVLKFILNNLLNAKVGKKTYKKNYQQAQTNVKTFSTPVTMISKQYLNLHLLLPLLQWPQH